jgi:hypothetical protein
MEPRFRRHWGAGIQADCLYAVAAERRNLDESIEELRQIADGRDDVLAEAAGMTAGSWYASPATHVGYELIAGMLILAGDGRDFPLDYDELEPWTRVGYARGCGHPGASEVATLRSRRRRCPMVWSTRVAEYRTDAHWKARPVG